MKKQLFILVFLVYNILLIGQNIPTDSAITEPSGGSYGPQELTADTILGPYIGTNDIPLTINSSFNGFGYDDNATENSGFRFVPPDPCGAAGTDRIIAVVNTMIECRNKTGTLLWRDGLSGFFSELGPPLGTFTFDPKVVWDHFENRFVVVTLEKNDVIDGDTTDESHILVAVSKTPTPATATSADWWYLDINSKTTITNPCWADYPGFAIDEEVVYITNNMFGFKTTGTAYEGVRLWIIDKGVTGGFYSGAAAAWKMLDPYPTGIATTTQPALIYGASGPGAGIGTYLVSYSGLTNGTTESIQVVRVNNPLPIISSTTSFTQAYVNIGSIEDIGGDFGWPALPDGPQLGATAMDIEVNDQRALDAVWRNDAHNGPSLWLTTTINPSAAYDAANTGETTAHWVRLNTSTWAPTLGDQGNIGGDDIVGAGSAVFTFFPSLAVDSQGNAYFGFAATSDLIYCGAYAAERRWADAASTVRGTETIAAGVGEYQRTHGGSRNRWGDYSAVALDPVNEAYWIFNQYALAPGSGISPEDGRWGTAWGIARIPCINGSIIYNTGTGKFNFCEDGVWVEK